MWWRSFCVVIAAAALVGFAADSRAAVVSDGSVFFDGFSGMSLDTTKWTATVDPPPTANNFVAVGGGALTIFSGFKDLDAFIVSNPGQIDFTGLEDWVYEIRFQVLPLSAAAQGDNQGLSDELLDATTRETHLIRGFPGAPDVFLTLLDGSNDNTNFSIGWGGQYSPIDREVLDSATTDLNRNQLYKMVAHHRNDNEVDFYLDDVLVGTRTAFEGTLDRLMIGDASGATAAIMVIDYVSIGLATEPTLLEGDYNDDGVVDAVDYTVWRNTFGQSGSGLPADGDNSGQIDAGDYTVWKDNYGEMALGAGGLGAALNVPEPVAVSLFVVGALGVACSTRSRRRTR